MRIVSATSIGWGSGRSFQGPSAGGALLETETAGSAAVASNAFRRGTVVPCPVATLALNRNRLPWREPVLAVIDDTASRDNKALKSSRSYFFFLPPFFFAAAFLFFAI
jgi:hypothetical protein